jgi:hypothetical protein
MEEIVFLFYRKYDNKNEIKNPKEEMLVFPAQNLLFNLILFNHTGGYLTTEPAVTLITKGKS